MKLFHFSTLLLISALLSLQACATTMHSAEPIKAQVVDADTNQPLEGVIVVAHWQVERKVWASIAHSGRDPRGPLQLKIMETVTDHAGNFSFPAWGPLEAPPDSYLEESSPAIVLFKPGYRFFVAVNHYPSTFDASASSTRTSQINGTTIKLKKFEGDLKAYAQALTFLHIDLGFAQQSGNCDWKLIPRMLVAMHRQAQIFHQNKIFSSLRTLDDIDDSHRGDQCGSASELLKDYQK